ncbi:hypothetical protein FQA39_LY06396 [Lamprigera yunnana]|nr:hypothetical protein FQA39_LY06396 [Lamprigera yunnana]
MKIYFATIVFILVGMPVEGNYELVNKYSVITKKCVEEFGFRFKSIANYLQKMSKGGTNAEFFCECIYQQLGQMNHRGEILYDDVKNEPFPFTPLPAISRFIESCRNEKGNGYRETAWKFHKCVIDKYSENNQNKSD